MKLIPRKGGGAGHGGGGRGGGGRGGGGKGGGSGKSGGGGKSRNSGGKSGSGGQLKVSSVGGLPPSHDEVTTYGEGGGTPIEVKSGRFKGSRFGGGTRDQVYGTG
jgi:hypothetical protein